MRKPATEREKPSALPPAEEGARGHKKSAPLKGAVSFALAFAMLVLLAWMLYWLAEAVFH